MTKKYAAQPKKQSSSLKLKESRAPEQAHEHLIAQCRRASRTFADITLDLIPPPTQRIRTKPGGGIVLEIEIEEKHYAEILNKLTRRRRLQQSNTSAQIS